MDINTIPESVLRENFRRIRDELLTESMFLNGHSSNLQEANKLFSQPQLSHGTYWGNIDDILTQGINSENAVEQSNTHDFDKKLGLDKFAFTNLGRTNTKEMKEYDAYIILSNKAIEGATTSLIDIADLATHATIAELVREGHTNIDEELLINNIQNKSESEIKGREYAKNKYKDFQLSSEGIVNLFHQFLATKYDHPIHYLMNGPYPSEEEPFNQSNYRVPYSGFEVRKKVFESSDMEAIYIKKSEMDPEELAERVGTIKEKHPHINIYGNSLSIEDGAQIITQISDAPDNIALQIESGLEKRGFRDSEIILFHNLPAVREIRQDMMNEGTMDEYIQIVNQAYPQFVANNRIQAIQYLSKSQK